MDMQKKISNSTNNDKQNPDLFSRSVKGAYWVIGLRVCTHLLDVAKVIILANLLGSAKWGLLAFATIVIKSIKIFTETGFNAALIQKKRDTHAYLDTAWTVGLIRGFVLFAILFFVAPYTAELFDGPATFTKSHLFKPAELSVKLREAKDPLSRHLIENFSPAMRQQLNDYDSSNTASESLIQGLIREMNRVVEGDNLYKSELFADIQLSAYTGKLINQADQNHDFTRLNRRLLQEVYQDEIKQSVIDVATTSLVIQLLGLPLIFGALGNIGTIFSSK